MMFKVCTYCLFMICSLTLLINHQSRLRQIRGLLLIRKTIKRVTSWIKMRQHIRSLNTTWKQYLYHQTNRRKIGKTGILSATPGRGETCYVITGVWNRSQRGNLGSKQESFSGVDDKKMGDHQHRIIMYF